MQIHKKIITGPHQTIKTTKQPRPLDHQDINLADLIKELEFLFNENLSLRERKEKVRENKEGKLKNRKERMIKNKKGQREQKEQKTQQQKTKKNEKE